jgi:hypothetical protein
VHFASPTLVVEYGGPGQHIPPNKIIAIT